MSGTDRPARQSHAFAFGGRDRADELFVQTWAAADNVVGQLFYRVDQGGHRDMQAVECCG
jgi:hypothetical protein